MSNVLIIGEKLALGVLVMSILCFIINRFGEANVTKIIPSLLMGISAILVLIIFGLIMYHFWVDVYPRLCDAISRISVKLKKEVKK